MVVVKRRDRNRQEDRVDEEGMRHAPDDDSIDPIIGSL
jgi:hypothetical protein